MKIIDDPITPTKTPSKQFMLDFAVLLEKYNAEIWCAYDGDIVASFTDCIESDTTLSQVGELLPAELRTLSSE